ncbi:MAG TPA: MBL fold metallo-hydrolase [Flavobacteriales bacterium]|jgi:glyoxylase-like metal-dependent hydrolase (beta-lactamase superfamily II)|nr:MBL fold metallo-hydrolase [Salibacteraceae bacterium]HAS35045.1 MBL fold metallo-hydrolase [Flavobacteriales bacterium]
MKIYPIHTGNFKLDGGAMFGVVPKSIWSRVNPADEKNMCTWAMRCMLVETDGRLILIDTGIGNKQSERFFSYYFLHGNHSLDASLNELGFHRDDITDVFLTHLHFDHCGGAIQWNSSKDGYEPAFPNAKFWSNSDHWKWATEPNPREKASFLSENILPIQESGQLELINLNKSGLTEWLPGFSVLRVDGHTDAQMLPVINYQGKTMVFCADLLPSAGHIPLPWVMAYDTRPLTSMKEKDQFLQDAINKDYLLFFEHDAYNELGSLVQTEKGVRISETFAFREIFS